MHKPFEGNLRRLALVLAAVAAMVAAPAWAGVTISELSVVEGDTAIRAGQPVLVNFTLRNTSREDVFVLAYETPLRGFERNMFSIDRDGEPIDYEGIIALRLGPAREDWIRIEAGGEVSAVIDLSNAYNTRRAGTYTVRHGIFQQVMGGAEDRLPVVDPNSRMDHEWHGTAAEWVASDAVTFTIVGNAPEKEVAAAPFPPSPDATYGCSSPSTLTSAQSTARSRALRAYNAAASYNSWYTRWFGTGSSYVSTIRGRFANAYNRLGATVDYYCGSYAPYCSSNTVLYTYKTTSNRIYVCSIFWNQSTSFKAHGIGHESYHWNTVAGADDVTYGQANCENLARTRPADARRNADNYAYAADFAP